MAPSDTPQNFLDRMTVSAMMAMANSEEAEGRPIAFAKTYGGDGGHDLFIVCAKGDKAKQLRAWVEQFHGGEAATLLDNDATLSAALNDYVDEFTKPGQGDAE